MTYPLESGVGRPHPGPRFTARFVPRAVDRGPELAGSGQQIQALMNA